MHPNLESALFGRGGVFTTADAVAAGLNRNEIGGLIRSGRWRTIRYGVHTTSEIWRLHAEAGRTHWLESAAVLGRLGRPSAVLSHGSAARLHDLVLPSDLEAMVTLTDPGRFRGGRGYRVVPAGTPDGDVVTRTPLRITSLSRTLIDLAREWDLVDSVVAMDDALADGRLTQDDLTVAVLAHSHWVGIGQAARAAGMSRVGAHSPHETRSRLAVIGAGLPEPMLQVAVYLGSRLIAILDMYWPEHGVFGESDGMVKFADPWHGRTPAEVAWAEKGRHDLLTDLGLVGVRFTPADLHRDLAAKTHRLATLLTRSPQLDPRVRIEPWRAGLRTEPRAVPWTAMELGIGVR